jgi:hypothetical protein
VSALARLRAAVREEGGLLAATVPDGPDDGGLPAATAPDGPDDGAPGPARLAAAGPRSAAHRDEAALAVEAVLEGYRLHYGGARALRVEDPDLALLAGDRLYALGLARLAALGDLPAIAELADVIGLGAQAHAAGDPDLAEAAWTLGAAAVGWGASPETVGAKARARAGEPGAAEALRDAARALAGPLAE